MEKIGGEEGDHAAEDLADRDILADALDDDVETERVNEMISIVRTRKMPNQIALRPRSCAIGRKIGVAEHQRQPVEEGADQQDKAMTTIVAITRLRERSPPSARRPGDADEGSEKDRADDHERSFRRSSGSRSASLTAFTQGAANQQSSRAPDSRPPPRWG